MQVIIREIFRFPGFYPTCYSRSRPINFHAKTSQSRESNNAGLRDCELNYFPPDEAYSSSFVAEEQKRHPFWFLLLRSSASNKLYIPIELQYRGNDSSTQFFSLFFFLRNAYTRSIRGDESPLVSIQTCKRSILFGLASFFPPPCICR